MENNIQALILDMDGVLWREREWIADPQPLFARIRIAGLKVAMATNNATRTISNFLEKFADAGVILADWQVISSAAATANILAAQYPERGELFVVGEHGLQTTLEAHGFTLGAAAPLAVVCGMDRQFTYDKLKTAARLIRNGARFIGTNPDRSFPTPEGLAPGAGAILAAIAAASDGSPEIIGKPQPTMYRQLFPFLGASPEQTLVVGDRLETDIAGGQALSCRTAVVLSGVSTAAQAAAWRPAPDFICADLTVLLEKIIQ